MTWINSLFIFLLFQISLGQKCKLPSGKEGYCRLKTDCFGGSDKKGCKDDFVCCFPSQKAKEKCKEYIKYNYKQDYNPTLLVKPTRQNTTECGMEIVPLVIGGDMANPKEFPHMVAIGYGKDPKKILWMCGGSLISEKHVLSAAHCSESPESGPATFARLGALNLEKTDNSQDIPILKRTIHPRYKAPSRYHDIAIFLLSEPVIITAYVRPACLQVNPDEFSLKKGIATGWGKTLYRASKGSQDLMKVTLSIIDYKICKKSFKSLEGGLEMPQNVLPSQICAGELKGGKDTCQGDSGGPLQIPSTDEYCMYSIIGVTSFGKFCGFKNSPAVYTRVSYYVPWIESIVWS